MEADELSVPREPRAESPKQAGHLFVMSLSAKSVSEPPLESVTIVVQRIVSPGTAVAELKVSV